MCQQTLSRCQMFGDFRPCHHIFYFRKGEREKVDLQCGSSRLLSLLPILPFFLIPFWSAQSEIGVWASPTTNHSPPLSLLFAHSPLPSIVASSSSDTFRDSGFGMHWKKYFLKENPVDLKCLFKIWKLDTYIYLANPRPSLKAHSSRAIWLLPPSDSSLGSWLTSHHAKRN